jgi:L-threonylcarbamoyladenylate synthase
VTTLRLGTDDADLARAAELLRTGGLVAIPTETVYGLAVRADDAEAVARLFVAKGRPADNPLIVHVADVEDVTLVASELTPLARTLLERLAPGPITVVLPARDDLPRAVTGGLDTVAVRIPDHPVARELLRRSGLPLAAPSANRSGRPSPTRAEHVLADLDGRIDAIVDGGATRVGLESTVVDARGESWRLLREGAVGREEIAAALAGAGIPEADPPGTGADDARSPGTRHRHYAPSLPVHLARAGEGPALAGRLALGGASVGLVTLAASRPADTSEGVRVLAAPVDVESLAAALFTLLRDAEEQQLDALVVEAVGEHGIGRAVMDRLRRAVAASGGTDAS